MKLKKKIIIITANEYRHIFFRRKIGQFKNYKICLCLSENNIKRQSTKFFKIKKKNEIKNHFLLRKKYEKKYFFEFIKKTKEVDNLKIIERGQFNNDKNLINYILSLKADYLLTYGCSIIKNPILKHFKQNSINIHLGLSPYYLGSATNFWPFVNDELQFVGVTFMKLEDGIDDGPIIHQIRPKYKIDDNVHKVGNKLIKQTPIVIKKIFDNYKNIKTLKFKKNKNNKLFFKNDIKESDIKKVKFNQKNMMIKKYINNQAIIEKKYPIYQNKLL